MENPPKTILKGCRKHARVIHESASRPLDWVPVGIDFFAQFVKKGIIAEILCDECSQEASQLEIATK